MFAPNSDGRYAGYLTAGELRRVIELLDSGAMPTKNVELALPSVVIKRDRFTKEQRGAWGSGVWPDRRPAAVAAVEGKRDDAPVRVPDKLTGGTNSRTFAKACEAVGAEVRAMHDPLRAASELRSALDAARHCRQAAAGALIANRNHDRYPEMSGACMTAVGDALDATIDRVDRLVAALQTAGW